MRKATATHVVDCDVETFWKTFLDDQYNKDFYLGELGFKELEVIEKNDTSRRLRAVPKMDLPGPVAKLLGDRFGYEERGTLDRAKNTWSWRMIPNTMTDKLRSEGTVRVEAIDGGKCRRIDEFSIEAKVFGVGGLLEGSAEKEVTRAWEKESVFMNKWLAKRST